MPSAASNATGPSGPPGLGPYRVIEPLGAGGMGVVYRARHETTGQVVAVKTVHAQGEAVLAGIRREVRALRALAHPGVVRILDDGLEHGVPWYAMELLEGPTLRRFHRERSGARAAVGEASSMGTATTLRGASSRGRDVPTPRGGGATPAALPMVHESLTALRAVCRTLAFVHGRGVVHRDLKPDNVILTADRGPVIVDFGIAAQGLGARGREVLHAMGRAVGSPGYMAPEQILGEIVDARADLYALGCMLFEAVTGRLPFDGETTQLVLSRKLYEAAPSLRSLVVDVPDALERLVGRLLARHPHERPGHADGVGAVLEALGAAPPTLVAPAAEPYLYRPGLAGRVEALEAIDRVLGAASVARVAGAPEVEVAGADASVSIDPAGSSTLAVTAIGPTLDVTSGRELAARRRGGFVLVGGESGVGKTRLALEITARAAQRGFRVITGQCERVGAGAQGAADLRAAPLHPLRELLHAIADRCRALGAGGYDVVLGARGPVLAAFEPGIADLEGFAEHPPAGDLPPEAARTRLHEALGDTLKAFASAEPVLLVLDDLQWADEQTRGFLGWMDERWFEGTPVIVLATFRVEEESADIRALVQRRGAHVERLSRLDERAVSRIVRDMLAVESPDTRLVEFLHRHTEGNPFFVAEYLRAAIERGLLLRDESGRWCFDAAAAAGQELERLALPASLRDLVTLRLDGLGAEASAIARALAVLGREVDASLLGDALHQEGVASSDAMVELIRRHVVDEPEPGVVRFLHDKLREVVYANLAPTERQELHRRAARALAAFATSRGELDRVASDLAHHHAEAGEVDRALGYLDQAAERAASTGASADALRSFELAASLFDRRADARTRHVLAGRRVRWERRAAEAHHALGGLRAAEERGRAALRLATESGTLLDLRFEDGGADRARFAVGAAWAVGRQLARLAVQPRGARPASGEERWREAALAAEKLAQTYLFLNDSSRAALASVLATGFAARFGPSPELARGHAQLGIASSYVPSDGLARACFARADRIARTLRDAGTDCAVDFMCGYWSMGAGRFDDCDARLGAALDRARALSDRRREEETLALLAMAATFRARFDDALSRYAELEALSRRTRNPQAQGWARSGRASVWSCLGRVDDALDAFDDLEDLIESTSDQSQRILTGQTAPLHLARGDRARARAVAERTLQLFEAAPPAGSQLLPGIEGCCGALLTLWTTSPPGPARRALEPLATRAVVALEAFARLFPIGRPDAMRLRAAWLVAHGRPTTAPDLLRAAVADAQRLGMPVEEARARAALGLRLDGPSRSEQLDRARHLLQRSRARLHLDELNR